MQEQESPNNSHALNFTRLGIGLLQGVLLYFLVEKNSAAFNPLVTIIYFVPLILMHGIGNMRIKMLVIWGVIISLLIAGLTYYDNWRLLTPVVTGSFHLFFFLMVILFIAHALVVAADADRRWVARYSTYFDVAWKMWVQFVLAAAFLHIFWLLLWFGAVLFMVVKVDFFKMILTRSWFYFPISTLAVALAFNVMDVRPNLVRAVRTLVLTLLSWLLPLITLITAGFLCTLIFTGLLPLWQTAHATSILLTAAASVIILINAAYQDGNSEKPVSPILRYAGRLAALTLIPAVAIAIYALSLRVGQYGWTVDRILAAFCAFTAAFYALGYTIAVLKPGEWLRFIATWNIMAAVLVLILLVALLTPIADPARLFVMDQMARLQSGKISKERFDFQYLHKNGERFGHQALLNLQQMSYTSDAPYIREQATQVLQNGSSSKVASLKSEQKIQQINMHVSAEQLPKSFLNKDWRRDSDKTSLFPQCLVFKSSSCDLWVMDLKGDGEKEIILFDGKILYGFLQDSQQNWKMIGIWEVYRCDPAVQKAVAAGQFKKVSSGWPDMQSSGWRIPFSPLPGVIPGCSQTSEN